MKKEVFFPRVNLKQVESKIRQFNLSLKPGEHVISCVVVITTNKGQEFGYIEGDIDSIFSSLCKAVIQSKEYLKAAIIKRLPPAS